jgi:hypothetical protein
MNNQNNNSENLTNFTVKSRVTDSAGKDNVLLSKKSVSSHGTLSGNSHRELSSKHKDLFMRNSSAEKMNRKEQVAVQLRIVDEKFRYLVNNKSKNQPKPPQEEFEVGLLLDRTTQVNYLNKII